MEKNRNVTSMINKKGKRNCCSLWCHLPVLVNQNICHVGVIQRLVLLMNFHLRNKFNEIYDWFPHLNSNKVIATGVCICYDSAAVMACPEICSNWMSRNWVIGGYIFYQIWIVREKIINKTCHRMVSKFAQRIRLCQNYVRWHYTNWNYFLQSRN